MCHCLFLSFSGALPGGSFPIPVSLPDSTVAA
jgi:hypothetical protein